MRGVNKVIIVGNLGADPESRSFPNGGMVCNISVATSDQWTDKQTGEKKEATEWHRIQFSNRLAEIASQYLRKGSSVYVEGKLVTRKWQDQNGQDRYSTEIRASNLQMLGGNQSMNTGVPVGGQQMGSQNQYQGQNQGQNQGFQNQGFQNQGFQNNNNGFNQGGASPQGNSFANQPPQAPAPEATPNQQPQPNQHQQPQPMTNNTSNPQDMAMSDAPADDDIPF